MNLYRKIALGLLQIFSPFLTDQAFLRTKYLIKFNHWPDLVNPKLFNEKIIWRILYDRQPRFQQISDKLALRDYVKEKGLEHYLPRQYYVTDDPSTIDFEDLPNAFVIKPNHAWGLIHIVYQKQMLNQEK